MTQLFVDELDHVELASILKDFEANDPILNSLPPYLLEIMKEILEFDELVVLARGLGLNQLITTFLRKVRQCCPNALVLILNSTDSFDFLGDDFVDTIGFNVTAKNRLKMYLKGGIYRITAPICVVDLLSSNLDPNSVSGLVLTNAERIGEYSPAAFAIKLLKVNSKMFVKAFSERIEQLTLPPSLPVRLRTLHVNTIAIYPRFHLMVDKSLPKLSVEEVIVELNESVKRMQQLLTEIFQSLLSDIKRRVPHLDLDYLSKIGDQQLVANPDVLSNRTQVDNILAVPDLAFKIRNALSSVWHKLSLDAKRSVNALATLSQLQNTLLKQNSFKFNFELELCLRDTDQPWVDLPSTDMLVAEARMASTLNRMPNKFHYLLELLTSIQSGERVLVACNSLESCHELSEFVGGKCDFSTDDDDIDKLEQQLQLIEEEKTRKREQKRLQDVNLGRPNRRRVRGGKNVQVTKEESDIEIVSVKPKTKKQRPSEFLRLKLMFLPFDLATIELNNFNPQHIILYDPNLTFTRELERYALNVHFKPKVYFMYYQRSVEELQYLSKMRKEKDSFTKIIREKGLMPMTFTDDADSDASYLKSDLRTYKQRQRVVVDAREFRSALPFFIYMQKMDVIPVTLLVGDYILSPDMVVERKSIADLVGSFRNGRLYQQCESMISHYKTAILLIEFDGPNHFSMEPFKEIRARSSDMKREIQENISSLLVKFPKLKLIWSSSPLHTAKIFRQLKEFKPEPEEAECAMAGKSVLYDSIALQMMESLPGVTTSNSYLLAEQASNMTEVVKLSEDQMVKALGRENGLKLYNFIHYEQNGERSVHCERSE